MELPEDLIPADSRVEIDAKITAGMRPPYIKTFVLLLFLWRIMRTNQVGYFTSGYRMTEEELKAVQGRMWDE